ncbi:MAG: NAD(P)/FAD-dependent oxidoreductase [Candidatus Acidiferrales bacterium]
MRRIVILGAGFGGMEAAVTLDRNLGRSPDAEILLVSAQNYFMFTPLLPQIVSSYIEPRHIVQAIREVRGKRRYRFRREEVRSVDLDQKKILLDSGAIDYDSLIVALGSRTDYFGVPGARENSLDFKTLEDAVVLRERLLDFCEHADHTQDADERRRLLTVGIVGGGYTGVELICEMRDFFYQYALRRYRGISKGEIHLILVEASPNILSGVHPKLRAHALKRLQSEGIEIRYNARVTRCAPGVVEINGAERLEPGTVVWTAGVRAHELVEKLPGKHDAIGRAVVNENLQLESHPEVFVVGDSAAAVSGLEAPRVAPVAITQGVLAARNIVHLMRGEPLESYRYVSKGTTVSLGMNDAVVSFAGINIHGYFAWLLWNAIHLYKLVGMKKQLQVALDWSLGTLFPRDAAIVRRPRGCPLCDVRHN